MALYQLFAFLSSKNAFVFGERAAPSPGFRAKLSAAKAHGTLGRDHVTGYELQSYRPGPNPLSSLSDARVNARASRRTPNDAGCNHATSGSSHKTKIPSSSRTPSMRRRSLQPPNRGEGPGALPAQKQTQGPSVLLTRSAHSRQNRARMGTRRRAFAYGRRNDDVFG
jgi:hypothetical protein